MIGAVVTGTLMLAVFHLVQLFTIKDIKKKPENWIAPLFGIVSIFSNLISALGFGRPRTPIAVALGYWFCSAIFCSQFPGYWEWCELTGVLIIPLCLGFQYFWNGLKYGTDNS
jgi:hypothetical protein